MTTHHPRFLTFLDRVAVVHGSVYDYSSVIWTDATKASDRITITCPLHGVFIQTITNHVNRKTGCPACAKRQRYTHNLFLEKAHSVHGEKYDYSSVAWTGDTHAKSKLCITCPTHGAFYQSIAKHINQKTGCPACAGCEKYTLASFKKRAEKVHKNTYNYSEVIWTDATRSNTKVSIICAQHGPFIQTISDHITCRAGCPTCARNTPHTLDTFLKKARLVHGTKYDYSSVVWTGDTTTQTKLSITCPTHGAFSQLVTNHINGKNGCPKCKSSKGELIIANWLVANHIGFEQEYRFSECVNPTTNRKLPFDFWLPDHNTCIEFHGIQHYHPTIFGRETIEEAVHNLSTNQYRDSIKNDYCAQNGINIIIIPHTCVWNIPEILQTQLVEMLLSRCSALPK